MTPLPLPLPSQPRSWTFHLLRAAAVVLAAVLLLPYLIAPLYRFIDPVSTLVAWRWLTGAPVDRRLVPIAQMAPVLPLTVIVAEDGRFCSHHGVDFEEMREAIEDADSLADLRGGSTITQQVAKNLFLWPGRSVVRKILEFPLALWIDLVLPKRRILEIYLNIAEWGPNGQFGAEAASRFAFRKPAAALNAHEAALLAAILPNPHRRSARVPSRLVRTLARLYQRRTVRAHAAARCLNP
jgi:monofunctional biosynthetic peptidoglycan transglycosylase